MPRPVRCRCEWPGDRSVAFPGDEHRARPHLRRRCPRPGQSRGGRGRPHAGGRRRSRRPAGAGLRHRPRRGGGRDGKVDARLRRQGRAGGAPHLRVRGRRAARPRRQGRRPRAALGPRGRSAGRRHVVRGHLPGPGLPRRAGRRRGPAPPRPRLRDGAGHVPPLRRGAHQARRRARAPHQRRRARGHHRRAGRDGSLRAVGARGVRRLGRRGRVRLPRHGRGHRGAVPRLARHRRLADHAARDPHPGAGEGRHRGAEARVAAQAGQRRGDGRGGRDRARLRLRRRRDQGHRHADAGTRRRAGLRHQRRQDVVHVRGQGRRADAAGPHRSRPQPDPPRPVAVRRAQAARRRPRLRVHPGRGGAGRAGKMEGRPIDTIGYRGMHSYEVAFDGWWVPADCLIGGEARHRPGLLLPDGGVRERPAADRGPRHRRHAGGLRGGAHATPATGPCSASPSATTSSPR